MDDVQRRLDTGASRRRLSHREVQMTADPVLLLHGQPGDAHDWDPVVNALAGRARTIAFDRPGWNGRSAPRDLAGNVRAALDVLDAHGIARARIAGHSLGGAIAAWMAAEHPDRVSSAFLLAPSANVASLNRLDGMLASPLFGPVLTAAAFAGGGLALVTPALRRRVASEYEVEDRYLRRYARILLRPATWSAFTAEQRLLVQGLPALESRLGSVSVPVTIVIGTADRIVTPSSARELAAQIPRARLVELEGANHLLVQRNPDELAEIIAGA
jgi:pimeloyl-ACP methyl ester carboxylesterase